MTYERNMVKESQFAIILTGDEDPDFDDEEYCWDQVELECGCCPCCGCTCDDIEYEGLDYGGLE